MSLFDKRLPVFKALTSSLNPKAKSFSPKKRRLPVFRSLTSKLNSKAKSYSPKKGRGKKTQKKRRNKSSKRRGRK